MLHYNFDRIFRARAIDKPFSYLQKAGFSDNFASRIKNNRVSRLDLKQMERLCILLKCTPLDLMEWSPDKDIIVDDSHPLHVLRKSVNYVDMVKTISEIPLGKLERIEKLIHDEMKK